MKQIFMLLLTLCLFTQLTEGRRKLFWSSDHWSWVDDAVDWVDDAIDDTVDWVGDAWEDTVDWVDGAIDDTVDWFEGAWDTTVDWVEDVWGDIMCSFHDQGDQYLYKIVEEQGTDIEELLKQVPSVWGVLQQRGDSTHADWANSIMLFLGDHLIKGPLCENGEKYLEDFLHNVLCIVGGSDEIHNHQADQLCALYCDLQSQDLVTLNSCTCNSGLGTAEIGCGRQVSQRAKANLPNSGGRVIVANQQLTHPNAVQFCADLGTYLVIPRSQSETDGIRSLLPSGNVRAWLGIQKKSGVWRSDDPSYGQITYNWGQNEGNTGESTAGMVWQQGWDGQWYDVNNDGRLHYAVCAPVVVPDGYTHYTETCVSGANIVLYKDRSVQECADLCDSNSECFGFEYGINYAPSASYEPRDCQLQSSAAYQSCGGTKYNLDFFLKMNAICPSGFEAISFNLDGEGKTWAQSDSSRTIQDCANICKGRIGCTGFEYNENDGRCGTYTGGTSNVQQDESRLDAGSIWRSCLIDTGNGVKCADENGHCSCNGQVRYGMDGVFTSWREVTGSIGCNNGVFGDPLPGTVKACYCRGEVNGRRRKL